MASVDCLLPMYILPLMCYTFHKQVINRDLEEVFYGIVFKEEKRGSGD